VPLVFQKGDVSVRYFSAVTTLGTPQDVTLQELRVECFFPADRETEEQAARLRRGPAGHDRPEHVETVRADTASR
jgi:hypothetical protein